MPAKNLFSRKHSTVVKLYPGYDIFHERLFTMLRSGRGWLPYEKVNGCERQQQLADR